ncbi:MAG: bifunctional metallophosphatase/5'-nucleotidase [Bacteroidales bacterium]|nr:bifunctional metallophosphatase/5'-nucleotidase [Bacteroidales bacterium]
MSKLTYLLLLILASLSSCYNNNLNKEDISISIIETTDVHGSFFPFDYVRNKQRKGSLASVYSYVDSLMNYSNNIVLLDNGDILQGTPDVYYANYISKSTIHSLSKIMNYMNYDAASVGNHDIEAGHDVYDKYNSELNFPLLAANAIDSNTNTPYFKPYTIIEKQGIKIAVLGLITPSIPKWLPEHLWTGMYFEDMIISAQKWVAAIKKAENPDLIIGLFHAGNDATYGGSDTVSAFNENASVLVARQVIGFDAIFTGHDHHKQTFSVINKAGQKVQVLNAGAHAHNVAQLDINLHWDSKNKSYKKEFNSHIVSMENIAPNTEFLSHFSEWINNSKSYTEEEITSLKDTIFAKNSLLSPAPFINLIHQAQLELSGADISFAAPFSITAELTEGKFTRADLFNLYRYENYLCVIKLSGKEIKQYLDYSIDLWFDNKQNKDGNYLLYGDNIKSANSGYSLKNPYYNFDSGASSDSLNFKYLVNVISEKGNRIQIITPNFDLNRTYSVVLNSYRANGGGGHLLIGVGLNKEELKARKVYCTQQDFRNLLGEWLKKQERPFWPNEYRNWELGIN